MTVDSGAHPPATAYGIGADVPRVEDLPLLTGQARFVADLYLPDEVHLCVLRSLYPHARIVSVDLSGALAMPGVVDAFDGEAIGSALRPIPVRLGPPGGLDRYLQLPLARGVVRYVGEPVAVVLAGSRAAAEDAAEAIAVEYEPMAVIASSEVALAPHAPLLFPATREAKGNVSRHIEMRKGDVEAARRESGITVVEEEFSVQRHSGVPLETRGLVAQWDAAAQTLTVWGATKVPHWNRGVLATMLGLPIERVRLVEVHVGGGFGVRGEFYPEDFLVPFAAMRCSRPVKWIEDRPEHMVAANQSRQQQWRAGIACHADGTIAALWGTARVDMGAYMRTHGTTVPSLSAGIFIGPYRVPNYDCTIDCVLTNKTPTGTYRSPGRYEANFVRERLLDLAANRLGLDRAEIRRRNFISSTEMPYDTGVELLDEELIYDNGDFREAFEAALDRIDYDGFPARQRQARQAGRRLGLGVACFVEKTGIGPPESARLSLNGSGCITLATGAASLGQGHETTLAQVVAGVLRSGGTPVRVVHGDTAAVDSGGGTFGSRGAVVAANAAQLAAQQLRQRLLQAGARWLGESLDGLELHDGAVHGAAGNSVPLAMLAGEGITVEASFKPDLMTYAYGTHAAEVEVDTETGQIAIRRYVVTTDVGRVINPAIVEGQLTGGAVQGIGGALLEEFVYDSDAQPLATTFMDYLLPTAADVPAIEAITLASHPSPLNPLGVKGAGEGGIAAAGGAIANAAADALSDLKLSITSLPLLPQRLLAPQH